MRKDFSCSPGKHIVTWLLRCWDNGASSLELEGKEVRQVGYTAREGVLTKQLEKGHKSSASGDDSCQT